MGAILATILGSNLTVGVFSSFLGSVSMIAYRKSLQHWKAGTNLFLLSGALIGMISSVGVALFHPDFHLKIEWKIFFLLFFALLLQQWNAKSLTKINTYEKISTVQIFGNIRTFITLIIGFVLFGNTSLITLGIVLIAAGVLFASQYKGGTFQPPKAWKEMIIAFGISSIIGLSHVWFITQVGALGFFVYSGIIGVLVSIFYSLSDVHNELKNREQITLESLRIRTIDGGIFQGVRYVTFFLISSVGPVVSTLLGMLGNITTLLFGYFYLHEQNTAKEWGVNILLCVLVGLGFYFK